ncbi:hypothetical protein DAI22_10g069000 [Oryza sativa Japonica Group]|nr:hypothetical protein DAI22_10g069000 [Oryza sativa Japonica Group]
MLSRRNHAARCSHALSSSQTLVPPKSIPLPSPLPPPPPSRKRRPTPRRGTRDAASPLTLIVEAEDHRASDDLLRGHHRPAPPPASRLSPPRPNPLLLTRRRRCPSLPTLLLLPPPPNQRRRRSAPLEHHRRLADYRAEDSQASANFIASTHAEAHPYPCRRRSTKVSSLGGLVATSSDIPLTMIWATQVRH